VDGGWNKKSDPTKQNHGGKRNRARGAAQRARTLNRNKKKKKICACELRRKLNRRGNVSQERNPSLKNKFLVKKKKIEHKKKNTNIASGSDKDLKVVGRVGCFVEREGPFREVML